VEDEHIPQRLIDIQQDGAEIKQRRLDSEWIPVSDMSYVWWTYFIASNYTCLPFPGGLADQPEWILADFAGFNEIAEHEELAHEVDRLEKRQNQRK